MTDSLQFLDELENIIKDRRDNPINNSYTSSLLASGKTRVAQKVGEEGVEVALAAVTGSRDDIVNESADLIYHMLVLLVQHDICLADVANALQARRR